MAYIKGINSSALAAQQHTEKRLRKKYEANTSIAPQLKELGKISAFKEKFEGILLKDQNLSEYENAEAFISGREFGFSLIKNGFTEENYYSYLESREEKKSKNHR